MIGGNPGAVREAARELGSAGRDLDEAGQGVAAHARSITGEWRGSASDACAAVLDGLRSATLTVSDEVSACRSIYERYADELAAAQRAFTAAQQTADRGAADRSDAADQVSRAESMAMADVGRADAVAGARQASQAAAALALAGAEDMAAAVAAEARANEEAARAIDVIVDRLQEIRVTGPGGGGTSRDAGTAPSAGAGAGAGAMSAFGSASLVGDVRDAGEEFLNGFPYFRDETTGASWLDPVTDLASSVADHYRHNPLELIKLIGDLALSASGVVFMGWGTEAGLGGGGLVLTGGGVVIGVPALAVGAIFFAGGTALVYVGSVRTIEDLTALSNATGSESRGAYGDPADVGAAERGKISQGHGYDHVHGPATDRAKSGVKFPGESDNPANYAGTREDYQEIVDDVVATGEPKRLEQGRVGFWKDGVVVIYDPSRLDKGTCFMPDKGRYYFDNELS